MSNAYDVIIVGSGPNGLAAGIKLAQEGLSVAIYESHETVGGGMRSSMLTLPGFIHDICSAVHPLAKGAPFFRTLPLEQYGLEWVQPKAALAHPFDGGTAAILEQSIDATANSLHSDAHAYKNLMKPIIDNWDKINSDIFAPLHLPNHPIALAKFGFLAIRSAQELSNSLFNEKYAKGLFAGLAGHAIRPINKSLTAAIALILGVLGHKVGWPIVKSGTQQLANALIAYFKSLGGTIFTGNFITNIDQLPKAKAIILDVGPKQLIKIADKYLSDSYKSTLKRYRYGPGVFKIDWALSQPIPWQAKACLNAGTLHLGNTLEEIATAEKQTWNGEHPEKPYVLLSQPTLFDSTRAPPGKHIAWGYCHVPNSSTVDMTDRIEAQVERFAPGFKECIIGRSVRLPNDLEQENPNYVGGDISGGILDLNQLYRRPARILDPYSTPNPLLYLCSSSTPPGGGVHGMCGYHAALSVLKNTFKKNLPDN